MELKKKKRCGIQITALTQECKVIQRMTAVLAHLESKLPKLEKES